MSIENLKHKSHRHTIRFIKEPKDFSVLFYENNDI